MRNFAFSRAATVREAISQHGPTETSAYVAGGTTLIDLVKLDVMQPAKVVDVNRLPLNMIESTPNGGLRIGALVTNADAANHDLVRTRYAVLSEALLAGASPQLRNMATTGGNLMQRTRCSYFRDGVSACNKRQPSSGCAALEGYNRSHAILGTSPNCIATHASDMCVALVALEATVEVEGLQGERRIDIGDFFLLPGSTPEKEHPLTAGDLVKAVTLPAPLPGARSHYLKLRDRQSYEFALASAAVLLEIKGGRIEEARIAFGGIATKPWRSREAEGVLKGAPATRPTYDRAAKAALADARPRQHNAFKVQLAQQALIRALETVAAGNPQQA